MAFIRDGEHAKFCGINGIPNRISANVRKNAFAHKLVHISSDYTTVLQSKADPTVQTKWFSKMSQCQKDRNAV